MQHQGEKTQFISYMLLKKGWIDVLPQALQLTHVSQQAQVFSLQTGGSPHWNASCGTQHPFCQCLAAAVNSGLPLSVYFLPFCINPELLFLLPRHSHATTPNTVVFAENHSCAKSVTVFVFLRKDVLPQMKPQPRYWRRNHLRHPKHHRSEHRCHGGTPPRGATTEGGQWDQKAQLEERSRGMSPSSVPREVFVIGKWKKNLPSLSFAEAAWLCTHPLLWKGREGELEVREQLWAALFVHCLLLLAVSLPCHPRGAVPDSHQEIWISQWPLVLCRMEKLGEDPGSRFMSRRTLCQQPTTAPVPSHSHQTSSAATGRVAQTNRTNPGEAQNTKGAFKLKIQASAPHSKVIWGILELKIQKKLGEIPGWDRVSGGKSTAKMHLSREGERKSKNLKWGSGCMKWARVHDRNSKN